MLTQEQSREFIRLYTLNRHRIFAYILALVPNYADAEEILQEAAITLWESFHDYESGSDFRAWAFKIAFNKVRNFRRLRRHTVMKLSDHFIELVDQTILIHREAFDARSEALADCFQNLGSEDRHLIKKRYEEGASVDSVAKATGRSDASVYRSLARIHHVLFDCVSERTEGEGLT